MHDTVAFIVQISSSVGVIRRSFYLFHSIPELQHIEPFPSHLHSSPACAAVCLSIYSCVYFSPSLRPPGRFFNSSSAPLECDEQFWDLRDSVVQCELLILRQLNFYVSFEHPHRVSVCVCVFSICCLTVLAEAVGWWLSDLLSQILGVIHFPESKLSQLSYFED